MTQNEIKRVLENPRTQELVEFVDRTKQYSKMLMSPNFFHSSHSKRDREVIVKLIENFYDNKVVIKRSGYDSVYIDFKNITN